MRLRFAILMAVAASSPALSANPEDAALNAVYARLAAARAANDVPGMSAAFGAEGILIDARPGAPITGSELAQRLQPMAERVQADGVRISTSYRIERRSVIDDVAVDAGYMRQTMARGDGQTGTRYARFLVTMQREADGKWVIIGDASMPSDEAAFAQVTKQPGLHYDG